LAIAASGGEAVCQRILCINRLPAADGAIGKIPIRRSPAGAFLRLPKNYFPLNAGAAVAIIIAKAETAVMLIQTSLLTWRRRIL
jgi:hypothetical protein